MGKKAGHKATKKFAKSGQLKKEIQARHKQRGVKKRIERKKEAKAAKERSGAARSEETESEGEVEEETEGWSSNRKHNGFAGMSVDDFLSGGFLKENEEEDDNEASEEEGEDIDDDQSFASVDELDASESGRKHRIELSELAEKDPEFFKYLQENDRELLNFEPDVDEDMEDLEGADGKATPLLTMDKLNKWQKAILENNSLKALRKLLLAFRSAVHIDDKDFTELAYAISSPSLHNKLVSTALRYTPVVLNHHIPYLQQSNGKIKPPAQSQKLKALSKLILSFFYNILHLIGQNTDVELRTLALSESSKVLPYVQTSRKAIKTYISTCLEIWSSAQDEVRIASFLALRRLATSSNAAIMSQLLKMSYLTLVRSSKGTTGFTMGSINLMKNTAAELYCTDHQESYLHAFKFIRQLAIHLRTSLKTKTKESYQLVYNWQYVQSVDFWSIVLSQACSTSQPTSPLQALIYPLVQVSIGSLTLNTNTRSYPFHLQILRSLSRLCTTTGIYIPLVSPLLTIISSLLPPSTSKHSKFKPSTLRPLDLTTVLRAPAQYANTRVYVESLAEESIWLLASHLSSPTVGASIAFPEIVLPLCVTIKRALKRHSRQGKESALAKQLLEYVEDHSKFIIDQRRHVRFGPGDRTEVATWESKMTKALEKETPLGKWCGVLKKQREKRKELIEKSRQGEAEIIGQDTASDSE